MRAVRFYEYGGPEVLRLEEVPAPVPADGEVLLKGFLPPASGVMFPLEMLWDARRVFESRQQFCRVLLDVAG